LLGGASAYLGFAGQSSCGCFGVIPVSPWVTFGLDVGVLAVLGFCRPPRAAEVRREKVRHGVSLPGALGTAAAAAAALALLGGAFWLLAGDPNHALSRLRGESITVEPAATSVGEEIAGASRSFSVTLTNHTNQPVRIIGGTTGCGCIATVDLPLRLAPANPARSACG